MAAQPTGPQNDLEPRREAGMTDDKLTDAVYHARAMLEGLGVNCHSEHSIDTPKRLVKMLHELTTPEPFNFTTFESDSDEMIIVKDITFSSLCAHHTAPFVGRAHIGYVPDGRIAGLSKFARAVRYCAKAFTVQEELTSDIYIMLEDRLSPQGLAVVLEAEHMCMTIRGVQAPGTKTITSKMGGVFAQHDRLARQEFLNLIKE